MRRNDAESIVSSVSAMCLSRRDIRMTVSITAKGDMEVGLKFSLDREEEKE